MNVREALDNIYKEFEKTYEEAKKEGHEQGLEEAWECARSIVDCKVPFDFWELASGQSMLAVFRQYSAKEAIAKIKEYEEKQKQTDDEIKVGDEVYSLDKNYKSVVTAIFDTYDGLSACYFTQSGKWAVNSLKDLHKTGRHFPQIAEVLQQMQEEE